MGFMGWLCCCCEDDDDYYPPTSSGYGTTSHTTTAPPMHQHGIETGYPPPSYPPPQSVYQPNHYEPSTSSDDSPAEPPRPQYYPSVYQPNYVQPTSYDSSQYYPSVYQPSDVHQQQYAPTSDSEDYAHDLDYGHDSESPTIGGGGYADGYYQQQQPSAGQDGGTFFWSVAIKKPGNRQRNIKSSKAWYVSSGHVQSNETDDIMEWMHTMLDHQQWDGFFAYNDQPPGCGRGPNALGPDPSSRGTGHCKGLVAWNDSFIGWLVHSLPRWPQGEYVSLNRQNYSFPPIEDSQLVLAQSFAFVVMPMSACRDVIDQLVEMQAFVFYSSPRTIWPYPVGAEIGVRADDGSSVPRMIQLGSEVYHIAKNGAWNECIYHEFMGRAGLGKGVSMAWRVQTWSKEADLRGLQFHYVRDVRSLEFPDSKQYKNGSAHSKWAISHEPEHALVFFGDLNRALSQNRRGGGGILIQSRVLWEFMDALCVSYFVNGISYEQ